MSTFHFYNQRAVEVYGTIRPGNTVYPVRHQHIHTGEWWDSIDTEPGRTNMSREPRERGWLGTTNDVSAEALGSYVVESVTEKYLNDGRYKVSVKCKAPPRSGWSNPASAENGKRGGRPRKQAE